MSNNVEMEMLKMMYSDFVFWFRQQPPEIQQRTVFQFIGLFAIVLIVCSIADYIKRKWEE